MTTDANSSAINKAVKTAVLAGIVLFEPEPERLWKNLDAVLPQVNEVLLVDNGSGSIKSIQEDMNRRSAGRGLSEKMTWILNESNQGIASALDTIMSYAKEKQYSWVLTLDQDSVALPGLIDQYLFYTDRHEIGQMGCRIRDRNFSEIQDTENHSDPSGYKEVPFVITSGSFMNCAWYEKTPGYDTKMFIDSVDVDISYALRKAGAKVIELPFEGLLHEIGHGRNVKLFGRSYIAYNHSAERNYYIARNHLYLQKKYPEEISRTHSYLYELRMELIILLYEEDKWKKLKKRWKGIRDRKKL